MKNDSFSSPLLARFYFRPIVRKSSFSPQTPPLHPLSASHVLWPRPSSAQALAHSWPGREATGTHQGPGTPVSMADTARCRRLLPRACAPWTAVAAPYKVARRATANPSWLRIALLAPPPDQAELRAAGQCAAAAADSPPPSVFRANEHPTELRDDEPHPGSLLSSPENHWNATAHGNASRCRCPPPAVEFRPLPYSSSAGEPLHSTALISSFNSMPYRRLYATGALQPPWSPAVSELTRTAASMRNPTTSLYLPRGPLWLLFWFPTSPPTLGRQSAGDLAGPILRPLRFRGRRRLDSFALRPLPFPVTSLNL
jgi:hypothetical protein